MDTSKRSLAHAYRQQKETESRRKMWLGGQVEPTERENSHFEPELRNGLTEIPNEDILDVDADDFEEPQKLSAGGVVGPDGQYHEDEDEDPPENNSSAGLLGAAVKLAPLMLNKGGTVPAKKPSLAQAILKSKRGF
jgi:hypothetical protein